MAGERFILIPGMGADGRMFEAQAADGLRFESPSLPVPEPREDLPRYAARVAREQGLEGCPLVIGGASFGGMVACELARICRPRCVLLIASCRTGRCLPRYDLLLELASRLIPDGLVRRRTSASALFLSRIERLTPEQMALVRDMSARLPVQFTRRVAKMILRWRGARVLPCPVYHIHGARDWIIPLRSVRPDEVVASGGHLINMTHPGQVNAFLRRHLGDAHCASTR